MKIAYVESEGIALRTVQRGDLTSRLGDTRSEVGRLEHLDLGAEAEQLAIGVAEVLEGDDGAPI